MPRSPPRSRAIAFRRRDAAPVRLGLTASIAAGILAPVLAELQDRIKGLELSLRQAGTDALVDQLLNSQLDAAVLVEPEKLSERLNRWPLFAERYVVLCARTHRLANLAEVPLSALEDEPLLGRDNPGCDFAAALARFSAQAGFKPRIRHTAAGEDQIQAMASAALARRAVGTAPTPVGRPGRQAAGRDHRQPLDPARDRRRPAPGPGGPRPSSS